MKKLTLLLLLFSALTARGQDYLPLIEENRIWNVMIVTYESPIDSNYTTSRYKIEGTEIISDTSYHIVLIESEFNSGIWNNGGYVREDENLKIWYRNNTQDEDKMLYDFNLQTGDVFFNGGYELTVDSVTYTEVFGTIRKQIYLSSELASGYELWIEGIGSSRGFIESGNLGLCGGNTYLLCLYFQDDLIWQNPNFEDCAYNSTGLQDLNTPDVFQVKYHADFIEIINTSDTFKDADIEVYDIFGRVIFSDIITANSVKIQKTDLQSKGVYIYRISSKTQTITKGKLINF